MEVSAKLRFLRMSPKKVRLVVDVVRGLDVQKAESQLTFLQKGAARPVLKLLRSAIANAENNFKLKKDNLYLKRIFVDQGPALKRWRSRAFGRAAPILKRSSHITVILDELKPETVKARKAKAAKKTVSHAKSSQAAGKQPVVDFHEVKHEAKGKAPGQAQPGEQAKKPFISFKNIKNKFTRRMGE